MRRAEKFILCACAYTVLICSLFLAFAAISKFSDATLNAGRFFLIFFFGFIITLANSVLSIKSWHIILRLFIHYVSLLAAFCFIFVISGNIKLAGGGAVFSAIIIFTFLYVVFSSIVYFLKKSINIVDKKLEKKSPKTPKENKKYTPRFGND